ncbi:MAG: hypothetical protein NVV82_26930 [Sporocytophaga sp.]|nr:hypothetical protein [Sporocytophaga sp.]
MTRIENTSPYAPFTDQDGDYNPGLLKQENIHFLQYFILILML